MTRTLACVALTIALCALCLLQACQSYAGPLRIALIPPQDYEPTLSQVKGAAGALGLTVDELTPEQLVDREVFTPAQYPLAVFSGAERYCYTVKRTGDGATALMRYLREGGVLLVAGMCWPLYRPVDWSGSEWITSQGKLPQFSGEEDRRLQEQMAAFGQTEVGSFNRYLGLNIAGEGTTQFEKPEETITFRAGPGKALMPGLPDEFPFPTSGDVRFRPASVRSSLRGAIVEAVAIAVGESGNEYGPGIVAIDLSNSDVKGGTVLYVWGTLMSTAQGPAITRDVLRYAAAQTMTAADSEAVAKLGAETKALRERVQTLSGRLNAAPEGAPARSYLLREADYLTRLLALTEDALAVRNFGTAKEKITIATEGVQRLSVRVEGAGG